MSPIFSGEGRVSLLRNWLTSFILVLMGCLQLSGLLWWHYYIIDYGQAALGLGSLHSAVPFSVLDLDSALDLDSCHGLGFALLGLLLLLLLLLLLPLLLPLLLLLLGVGEMGRDFDDVTITNPRKYKSVSLIFSCTYRQTKNKYGTRFR